MITPLDKANKIMAGLFTQLLEATAQGSSISPINFDAQKFHNSEVYKLRDEAKENKDAYLENKKLQDEQRQLQKEMEALENRPWYEKTWDTVSTFTGEVTGYYDTKRAATGIDPVTGEKLSEAERVKAAAFAAAGFIPVVGWAGRAAKGGNAVYKTVKGAKAVEHSLDAYKSVKAFSYLHKAEYGIYGLASANGFGEYITGKDIFGEKLNDDQRKQSLTEALFVLGVGGAGYGIDRVAGHGLNLKKPLNTNFKSEQLNKSKSIGEKRLDKVGDVHFEGKGASEAVISKYPDVSNYKHNMLQNPGPLADLPGRPINNFYGGKYNPKVLEEDVYIYRSGQSGGLTVPGQRKNGLGQWFTVEPADSVAQVRIDTAVKEQWINPKTGVLEGVSPVDATYKVKIPKGSTVYEGPVGYQGSSYSGGMDMEQIFVAEPWNIKGVEVVSEMPLK